MQLVRQILLTIAYSHIFSQPLTTEEVGRRLIYSHGKKKVVPLSKIESALSELKQKKLLYQNGEYWQLAVSDKNLAELRKKRRRITALKIKDIQPFLDFCQKIPWIRGVALTGSVSVDNASYTDDVDVMLVIQPERLWLVRPVLAFFSFLKGKRRSWNHEESNSWCLNLWLEEDQLHLPPKQRSVYTAYEIC